MSIRCNVPRNARRHPARPTVYLLSAFSMVEAGYYRQYHPGRKSGGSHFVFLHSRSEIAVSIPFRRPIKPIYVAQFLALIDDIGTRE